MACIQPILLTMKLTTLLMITVILQAGATSYAQKITLSEKNAGLESIFNKIRLQTGYDFMFSGSAIKDTKTVSINVRNAELSAVMDQLLRDQPLTYKIEDRSVVISRKTIKGMVKVTEVTPPSLLMGKVTDEKGAPLAGVTVTVIPADKRKKNTTFLSNNNGGAFVVSVEQDDLLQFSFIGYKTQEHLVSTLSQPVVIKMISSVGSLDEIQVIGYGTTSRRLNTGAVASINAEDIAKQPVANPLLALQGRVAGAVITQNSGLPGGFVDILIRGASSISSRTEPLYVIDGVPYNTGAPASVNGSGFNEVNGIAAPSGRMSPFNIVNSDDIERIDILKDADATAIFGTKGANGVVMITTKKARQGKTQLSLNLQQGIGRVPRLIPVLSLAEYLDIRRLAFKNDGLTPTAANARDLFTWSQTESTDWQKKYLDGNAQYTNINATVQGGDARTRVLLSTGYNRETTVFPGENSSQRLNVRLNADHNSLDKKLNINANISYGYNRSDLLSRDYASNAFLPPNLPLYNTDGTFNWSGGSNPEAELNQRYMGNTNSLISNLNIRYTLIEGLELQVNSGFNRSNTNQNQQQPAISQRPQTGTVLTDDANFGMIENQFYSVEPQLNYRRKIAKGNLTVLLGTTFQNTTFISTSINAKQYVNAQLLGGIEGAASYRLTGANSRYKYNSVFTRATYNWEDKYIVNANLRRDGSSRFGAEYAFGNFGSIGGAWLFTNENFLKDQTSFLSFGKLKANWGITGNDNIADYLYMPLYKSSGFYQGMVTLNSVNPANENIRWETTKKLDMGLDLGFFNDRLLFNANYYFNRSDNQLGLLALPVSTGYNNYMDNFPARIEAHGWEFELISNNVKKDNFSWKSNVNLTIPRTKIVSVSPDFTGAANLPIGYPLAQLRGYEFNSIDRATGRALYNKSTGGTTATPTMDDLKWYGNTLPIAYGGIGNDFQYRGLSLSFFIQVMHQNGYAQPRVASIGAYGRNLSSYYASGGWKQSGDETDFPKATTLLTGSYLGSSDYGFGDNTYAKLRNISLAYALPASWTRNAHLTNVKVFANAQNVHTWSKSKYVFDPETNTSMPPLRVITFGLSLSL
jgi:TonB-linked SusC/RagA family outer membrane protein